MIDGHIHFNKQSYTLDVIEKMIEVAKSHHIDELWLLDHTHKFKEFKFLYEPIKKHDVTYAWYHKKVLISIQEYLDFIELVKSKNYDINIKFGLEVCYFEETEKQLKEELSKYHFDFLIGSVHFIDGIGFDLSKDVWLDVSIDKMYQRYYEIMESLIKSNLFTTLAHPDSIKLYNYYPTYDLTFTYQKIAKLLNQYHMSTENNTGLWRYELKEVGLNKTFLDILKEEKVDIHLASDAHHYQDIGKYFALFE